MRARLVVFTAGSMDGQEQRTSSNSREALGFFGPRQFTQFFQLLEETFGVGPSAVATARLDLSSTNPSMLP